MKANSSRQNRKRRHPQTESQSDRLFEHFVMKGEDPEQPEALLTELQAEFNPQSTEQRQLIAQLATQLWRLRRASRFESAVIEAYRAEHAQADPSHEKRYNAAFDQARDEAMRPFYDQLRKQFPHLMKTPLDRSSEESVEPTPKKREVDRSDQDQPIKPDLSFVGQPSFQDALCNLARREIQLTEELGRTLNLLVPKDGARIARATGFKHAFSSGIAVSYEDAGQFERLRSEFQMDLKPQTATEWYLVERIASLSWRLRRIPAFEVALLATARAGFQPTPRQGPQWAIDRPEFLWGNLTAVEREEEWSKLSAWQSKVERRTHEILGDDALPPVDSELWFIGQPDIQLKLAKLARFERSLARLLARTRKLFYSSRASRLAAQKRSRSHRASTQHR